MNTFIMILSASVLTVILGMSAYAVISVWGWNLLWMLCASVVAQTIFTLCLYRRSENFRLRHLFAALRM